MDNDQTTITALRAGLADRDRRIAELTETCLNAADKIDAAEAAVAAAVAAERARVRAAVEGLPFRDGSPSYTAGGLDAMNDVLAAIGGA